MLGIMEITPGTLSATDTPRPAFNPRNTISIALRRIVCLESLDSYPRAGNQADFCIVQYDYPKSSGGVTSYVRTLKLHWGRKQAARLRN